MVYNLKDNVTLDSKKIGPAFCKLDWCGKYIDQIGTIVKIIGEQPPMVAPVYIIQWPDGKSFGYYHHWLTLIKPENHSQPIIVPSILELL